MTNNELEKKIPINETPPAPPDKCVDAYGGILTNAELWENIKASLSKKK